MSKDLLLRLLFPRYWTRLSEILILQLNPKSGIFPKKKFQKRSDHNSQKIDEKLEPIVEKIETFGFFEPNCPNYRDLSKISKQLKLFDCNVFPPKIQTIILLNSITSFWITTRSTLVKPESSRATNKLIICDTVVYQQK